LLTKNVRKSQFKRVETDLVDGRQDVRNRFRLNRAGGREQGLFGRKIARGDPEGEGSGNKNSAASSPRNLVGDPLEQ